MTSQVSSSSNISSLFTPLPRGVVEKISKDKEECMICLELLSKRVTRKTEGISDLDPSRVVVLAHLQERSKVEDPLQGAHLFHEICLRNILKINNQGCPGCRAACNIERFASRVQLSENKVQDAKNFILSGIEIPQEEKGTVVLLGAKENNLELIQVVLFSYKKGYCNYRGVISEECRVKAVEYAIQNNAIKMVELLICTVSWEELSEDILDNLFEKAVSCDADRKIKRILLFRSGSRSEKFKKRILEKLIKNDDADVVKDLLSCGWGVITTPKEIKDLIQIYIDQRMVGGSLVPLNKKWKDQKEEYQNYIECIQFVLYWRLVSEKKFFIIKSKVTEGIDKLGLSKVIPFQKMKPLQRSQVMFCVIVALGILSVAYLFSAKSDPQV